MARSAAAASGQVWTTGNGEMSGEGAYTRFCEKNPPFFGEIFDVKISRQGSYGK
jgi:hypothetical protein